MIALAFSLPLGVQAGWGAVLAINLKKVAGIGSVTSGWIGCASTLSGCIGGSTARTPLFPCPTSRRHSDSCPCVLVGAADMPHLFRAVAIGALSDRFIGSLKTFVLVSYSLASVFFAAFGLLVLEYWVPSPDTVIPLIYATAIGGGFFLYCPIPLFYEMVVEETFPQIPAATSSGILSIMVTVSVSIWCPVRIDTKGESGRERRERERVCVCVRECACACIGKASGGLRQENSQAHSYLLPPHR
jgi:hypothetical protein